MNHILATAAGFFLDLVVGDPQGWWHPVRGIGWLVTVAEGFLRPRFPGGKQGELAAGAVLVLVVLAVTGTVTAAVLALARLVHPWLGSLCMGILCGQILAARSLKTESCKVFQALKQQDVEGARQAVSMIVGRDTAPLTREGIIRAAVETVAENASDGVVAPLCWMFLLGPLGGMLYKAVNTMDSMIGYRNDRYRYFGRAAARLDDVVNYVPARLSALCLVLAAFLVPGCSGKNAWRIWRRDKRNHASPNSAQGESACAGALGVRLAGDAWYFGILHKKPTIGDDLRQVEPEDILQVNRLMYTAAVLVLAAGCCLGMGPAVFRYIVR